MTGFEYCAATEMLYEGMDDDALKCIKAIRDRHDGAKRNPFSESECGHHYARSMASWSTIIALSDFQYSGVAKTINFTSRPGRYFWSNGYSWGVCEITPAQISIEVLKGSLDIDSLTLTGRKMPVAKKLHIGEGGKSVFNL